MKQLIIIGLLFAIGIVGFGTYDVLINKNYSSVYEQEKKKASVEIKEITFDKEKIERLNSKIKTLKIDSIFKLKLTNLTETERQPLFIDTYAPIYQKILQNYREANNYK